MNRIYCLLACLAVAASCRCGESDSAASNLVMPSELVGLANRNGFKQIDDFYVSYSGTVNAPFVYGYRPDMDYWKSAAFWCEDTTVSESGDRNYFLVFAVKKSYVRGLEIEKIVSWYTIGGLTLLHDTSGTLDEFVSLDNPEEKGPLGQKVTLTGVMSNDEGASYTFCLCDEKWYVKSDIDP